MWNLCEISPKKTHIPECDFITCGMLFRVRCLTLHVNSPWYVKCVSHVINSHLLFLYGKEHFVHWNVKKEEKVLHRACLTSRYRSFFQFCRTNSLKRCKDWTFQFNILIRKHPKNCVSFLFLFSASVPTSSTALLSLPPNSPPLWQWVRLSFQSQNRMQL